MINSALNSSRIYDQGRVYSAVYSIPENEMWLNNPLIEALPKLLEPERFMELVCFLPPHVGDLRGAPSHLRLTYIERALQFFVPSRQHVLLSQRFARIIRDGYVGRNPLADLGWTHLHHQLDHLAEDLKYGIAPYEPPAALGFAIIGTAGVGKTSAIDAVLRTYPQAIVHRTYTDHSGEVHKLTRTQVVSVKLNCPEDGTLGSLCMSFFHEVDRITGTTNYYKEYGFVGNRRRTATAMLPDMARISALLSVGVLIIDEIQFLNKQRSGGSEKMLRWFTRLANEINLPVILIGTPAAREVLNGAFHQRRRNAGQGEFYWRRMARSEEWNTFLRALWRYEFVRHPTELIDGVEVPEDLSDVLYRESVGIADLAVKLFMMSQDRAINTGKERLTPSVIERVAATDFAAVQEIVRGMRDNDPAVEAEVDDIFLEPEQRVESGVASPTMARGESTEHARVPGSTRTTLLKPEVAEAAALPSVARAAKEQNQNVARAMREAGHVASPIEFGV